MRIIAIDVSNDVERSRKFYEQYGFTIPTGFDVGGKVSGGRYGVIATPTNYLLDADGRIVWRQHGFKRGDEGEMRRQIEELLAAGD